jgi:hypothetical protein
VSRYFQTLPVGTIAVELGGKGVDVGVGVCVGVEVDVEVGVGVGVEVGVEDGVSVGATPGGFAIKPRSKLRSELFKVT